MSQEQPLYKRVMEVPLETLMTTTIKDLEQTVRLLEIEAKQNVSAMLWVKTIIETRKHMN